MLLVIVVVFVSSIGIRYRATKELPPDEPNLSDRGDPSDGTWTTWVRNRWLDLLPPKKMLPSTQPTYVRTWVYSFGMLMIGSLFWIVVSGLILTLKGQEWYHLTEQGRYIRSTHAWATQFFFLFMAVHFLGVLAGSAWRGGRKLVWVTGMLAFLASVGEAFTGFLIQGNADSQWIAAQAKDGLNAVGVGSQVNTLNYGQMLTLHIAPFVAIVGALIVAHILLIRRHGVVPPVPTTNTKEVLASHE